MVRTESIEDLLRRLPQRAVDYVKKQLASGVELTLKKEPYFSKVRLEAQIDTTVSNVVTYKFPALQKARAFDYGIGAPLTTAGFMSGIGGGAYQLATEADTNLQEIGGKVTNGSDLVVIESVAVMPTPKTDPVLLRALMSELVLSGGFAGNVNDYRWGNPLFLPAGGGLYGSGQSKLAVQDVNQNIGQVNGFITNGLPAAGDLWPQDDVIVWGPKPMADSSFAMEMRVTRDVIVSLPTRAAGTGGVGPAAVVLPTTAGADGTFVEFYLRLISSQIGPRPQR
jgi:hypothetical protein